jgi:glycosyltransferase involved in cell wall biosynthesis
VHNSRSLKGRLLTGLDLKRTQRYEGKLVHAFDRVLVTSPADKAALEQVASHWDADKGSSNDRAITQNTRCQQLQVLPNGVSLQKAARGKQLPAPQTRVNGKPIIGYVGAFEYFIDWRCMIDSAKLLPECHFLLVGSGRDWEATRQYAAEKGVDNVEFTGGVPHSQVFAYINRFDVCLNLFRPIPVSHRACPIKLFEYLSMEKPVISTRLDELRHVDTGFLYYAADAAEVASQVRQILGDPQTAASRVQAGHALVVRSYEWTAIARRFEGLVMSQMQPAA